MKKLIVLIFLPSIFFAACGAKSGDYEPEGSVDELPLSTIANERAVDKSEEVQGAGFAKEKKIEQNKNAAESIDSNFIGDFDLADQRYLEYKVTLVYDSRNVLGSRKDLLSLVKKYGFLKTSSTSIYGNNSYFNTEIVVKSDDLIKALQDFYLLGKLKSENLEVIDHTPDLVKNSIDRERAQTRIERRLKYTGKVSTQSRNFTDIESSLASSEDNIDAAKFQKWLLEDRVKWATVNIRIDGPVEKRAIDVPDYKEALIVLLEFSLKLGYVMIVLVPLWIFIIFLIIAIRNKWFRKLFSGKKK